MGSYGVHGDAQRESLRLVLEEAKAYARAVKADDAEVPMHLWDNRVNATDVPKRQKVKALSGFRKLGFRWFRRGLVWDCFEFMRSEHGKDWRESGIRREAAGHTTWFEFNAGSQLVHFSSRQGIEGKQETESGHFLSGQAPLLGEPSPS